MKVMIVTPYYHPKIGGLENYARQLGLSLRAGGKIQTVVVTSNHNGCRSLKETVDGTVVYRLGTWFKLSNTPLNPLWPFMIRRLIKRERPDIIQAHTPVPSLADAAALAAGRTPLIITYHAATVLKHGQPLFNVLARAYRVYERLTLRKATQIIAVSDYVKHELGNAYSHKTVVIPNAIWSKEIETRIQPDAANFIFIGSLDRTHGWKGLTEIILAIEHYRQAYDNDIHLTIVGEGDRRSTYEAMVRKRNLASLVSFVGAQTGEAKNDLLRQSTALICYPTTANDAFPTVLLEAWAKAVPVLAASIGPIPSLIEDGVDGILVEPRDPVALAGALRQIMSHKSTRTVIARAAQQRTQTDFTWERQAHAMGQILEQLV